MARFLTQADKAVAMANYPNGAIDEDLMDKVRGVIRAWQKLLVELTVEYKKSAEVGVGADARD